MTTTETVVELEVDGEQVQLPERGQTLLDALRDGLGKRSVKDGCSPQGQCGCCTVLVDGQPRVACVTPLRRTAGRSVTTLEGFTPEEQRRWGDAFASTGASQCGFCTPGIIVRLAGLEAKKPDAAEADVARALSAHLCRCTGWQTIIEAWEIRAHAPPGERNFDAASRRAEIEGHNPQRVAPGVALGEGGFADDVAPDDALVAVLADDGRWVVAESVHEARTLAGKVQGRRTTLEPAYPIDLPPGTWDATLKTTWVDPAYLETDASWAEPGAAPASPLANGGAFGAKLGSPVTEIARRLADEHGRPVRVLFSREDSVRHGPKRPPVAGGAAADGTGILRIATTPGIEATIAAIAPGLEVVAVDVAGELATSPELRAAGWAEAVALLALARGAASRVTAPGGGWAEADVGDESIRVVVSAGDPLDDVTLRSYCIGAAHMAYSWVTSEALAVDEDGVVRDLTVRSFGVLRAADTPRIDIEIIEGGAPVNGSDAVFAAVAAATAVHLDARRWPHSD